jgi:hypothetical protein
MCIYALGHHSLASRFSKVSSTRGMYHLVLEPTFPQPTRVLEDSRLDCIDQKLSYLPNLMQIIIEKREEMTGILVAKLDSYLAKLDSCLAEYDLGVH